MDRIVRQIKEASEKPLSASRGSLQRSVTKAGGGGRNKKGKTVAEEKTPTKKAAIPLVAKATPPGKKAVKKAVEGMSEAYERKKRKHTASKQAIKIANESGESKEDALQMGRNAYAECL